eukprot:gene8704-28421_t
MADEDGVGVGVEGATKATAVPTEGGAADTAAVVPPQPPPQQHPPPPPGILGVKLVTFKQYEENGNAFYNNTYRGLTGVPLSSVAAIVESNQHQLDVLEVILPPLSALSPGIASTAAAILEALPAVELRRAITGIALKGSTRLDERWCTLDLREGDGGGGDEGGLPPYVPGRITAVRVRERVQLTHFPSWRASLQEVEIFGSKDTELREDLNNFLPALAVLKLSGDYNNKPRLQALPYSIGKCTSLAKLDVSWCSRLQALPDSIGRCTSLAMLDVRQCTSLERLPESIGSCALLTTLDASRCTSLQALPESIGSCALLTTLDVSWCSRLQALPESIGSCASLTTLDVRQCTSLQALPKSIGSCTSLTTLDVRQCTSLQALSESIGNCTSLTTLNVQSCRSLQALPESIGSCTSLTTLDVSSCYSLEILPELIGSCALLTTLDASRCTSLQALPESIGSCTSLTTLDVRQCTSLQALPESIGSCTSLTRLNVSSCNSLQALPESIGGCSLLTTLDVSYCSSLQGLPESIGSCTSLTTLNVQSCRSLQALPDSIGSCTSLTTLDLTGCTSLQALPESIAILTAIGVYKGTTFDASGYQNLQALPESIGSCTSLTKLTVMQCSRLQALPESIGNCTSLTTLDVRQCTRLQALPESIGNCTSLTTLTVRQCSRLQALPDSIGGCTLLTTLDVKRCTSLERLPESIGGCTLLTTLNVSGCSNLETLPESIGSCTSLTTIIVNGCSSLEALPESIGSCASLITLTVRQCTSLQALPDSIGSCASLTTLDVRQCTSLHALPDSISCTSLAALNVQSCRSLQALPESIGGCTLLATLDARDCKSLKALPDSIGGCTSLTTLDVSECTSLQALPDSIGSCASLTTLDVRQCTSLHALPESIGSCTSLATLDVSKCSCLQALPESIGGCTSLTTLDAKRCTSLEALPESIGVCTLLTTLDVSECTSLKTLPQSIGSCASLITLTVRQCSNLETLPESIGSCTALITLYASYCYKLQSLPESIGSCASLTTLYVSNCTNLHTLPASIGSCASLATLNIKDTAITRLPLSLLELEGTLTKIICNRTDPLVFPPASVICTSNYSVDIGTSKYSDDDGNTSAAFSYMQAFTNGATQLARDRLMLIGDGGSGKTTLRSALMWSPEVCEQMKQDTRANVSAWSPAHVRQWIFEISTAAELADRFAARGIHGDALLALRSDDVIELCSGTHRNDVIDKLIRTISFLNSPPKAGVDSDGAAAQAAQATTSLISLQTTQDFVEWLQNSIGSLKPGVIAALEENEVDGAAALECTEDDWKEMVKPIGPRRKIIKAVANAAAGAAAADETPSIPASAQPQSQYAPLLDLPHVWTDGIEVESWTDGGYQLWDFAGQLEYYPAHQFFLSVSNTVYLLVADASKGKDHCLLRLQHWLSFVRSAIKGRDAMYGDGPNQLGNVQVVIVATHTDTPSFRRIGLDFLPAVAALLAKQFAPKIHVHKECFKVNYSDFNGGGLATLKERLSALRMDKTHEIAYPKSYAKAFAALRTEAGTNPESAVMDLSAVSEIISASRGDGVLDCPTVLKTFEAFGMLKQLGSKVLVEPVTWLTQITSAFVVPKLQSALAGYELGIEPVPSISFDEVRAMLCKRGIDVKNVALIVEMLAKLQLCFFHVRNDSDGANASSASSVAPRVILPAMLPPAHPGQISLASGRRFRCAKREDSIPATLMATVQASLYAVADEVLLLRAGLIAIKLFECNVVVRLSTPKNAGDRADEHHCSSAIDVLHDKVADGVDHEALNVAVLVVIGAWQESFESIPLIKSELCVGDDDSGVETELELPCDICVVDHQSARREAKRILLAKPEVVQSKYTDVHLKPLLAEYLHAVTSAGGPLQTLLAALRLGTTPRVHKEAIKAHLAAAANMAMDDLAATDASTVEVTANRFLEDLQSSIDTATTSWNQPDYKQPLHLRLASAKRLLAHFGHTVAIYCNPAKLAANNGAALEKISQMVLEPIVTCMRQTIESMLEDVHADSGAYQAQMAELNVRHKTIYDQVFSTLTAGPPLGEPQDVVDFKSMCTAISLLEEQTQRDDPPPRVQPESDILKLTNMCSNAMPHFKTTIRSIFGTVQRIELDFRPMTKALYRMAEKALLKGARSVANGGDGTVQESNVLDCSQVRDVVGCLVVCEDFRSMRDVIENLKEQAEPDVIVCEVKNRWTSSSAGGWRDLICILAVGPQSIICEVQIVHAKLLVARQGLDAHKAYTKYRSYFELLDFTGLLEGASDEVDGADGDGGSDTGGDDNAHTLPQVVVQSTPNAGASSTSSTSNSNSQAPQGKKRRASKFVAPAMRLGNATQTAAGLADLMGYTNMTIVDHIRDLGQGDQFQAVVNEIELRGTSEDKNNLRGLLDGTFQQDPPAETPEEIAAEKIVLSTKANFFTTLGFKEQDIPALFGEDSTTDSMKQASAYPRRRKVSIEKVKISAPSVGRTRKSPQPFINNFFN